MADYRDDRVEHRGGAGRVIGIIVLLAVVALALAWALGLFNVDTSGKLEAPSVAVTGGEVPNVQVEAATVDVTTKTETVEVPSVEVTKPGDDGSTKK